jgi:putative peptidoglycan lipid II flippase
MTALADARTWFGASTNRRILGAAATVAVVSLAVRAVSLAKDLAIAYRFGTGDALDAFLIALLLPAFTINVVASSLNSAFVPVFIALREREGTASADRLFRSVLAVSLGILAVVSVVLALSFSSALPHLGSNFSPSKLALTRELSWWLLPIVLLSGMTTLWTGVLNAGEQFALGAAAPVAIPVVAVIALVVGGGRLGIEALAGGTVVGYGIAAWATAAAASRAGWSITPRWSGLSPDLRRVLEQYAPVFAAACLMSGTALTDQAMASALSPGSVAVLSYGNKTVSLLTGLVTMSLGTAVLPHFSRMVARSEWGAVRHTLRTWVRLIAVVTIPLTIVMIVGSTSIVRLAFERGAFSRHDTQIVALVQAMYVIQIPFYTAGILFVRMLTSMQRNRTLFWGTGISLPLNVVLNYLFMQWMGVAGIALSTSVMYVVSCAYLGFMLHRALTAVEDQPALRSRQVGVAAILPCH